MTHGHQFCSASLEDCIHIQNNCFSSISGFYFQQKEAVSVVNHIIHYLNKVKVLKVRFNKLNIDVGSGAWHQYKSCVGESRSTKIASHGI